MANTILAFFDVQKGENETLDEVNIYYLRGMHGAFFFWGGSNFLLKILEFYNWE